MSTASSQHAARPRGIDSDERTAKRIRTMIDAAFLAEMGWDPQRLVLAPPDGHPLVIRPVCRAEACSTTATGRARILLVMSRSPRRRRPRRRCGRTAACG